MLSSLPLLSPPIHPDGSSENMTPAIQTPLTPWFELRYTSLAGPIPLHHLYQEAFHGPAAVQHSLHLSSVLTTAAQGPENENVIWFALRCESSIYL